MWSHSYWAGTYFAPVYWPPAASNQSGIGLGYYYSFRRPYKKELERITEELAQIEKKQFEQIVVDENTANLKPEKAAKQLAALEASLQDEINGLRIQRAELMRRIDDEEAILALLLSYPLH